MFAGNVERTLQKINILDIKEENEAWVQTFFFPSDIWVHFWSVTYRLGVLFEVALNKFVVEDSMTVFVVLNTISVLTFK